MKKYIIGGIIFILIAALLINFVAGCATSTKVPKGEKVLRLMGGEPSTLDPQIANDTLSAMYIVEIYSGLLTLVPVPNRVADQYIEQRDLPVLTSGIVEHMPKVWQEWVKKNYLNEGVRIVLAPDLAEEIPKPEYNSNGTVSYTFRIRENAKFQNGKKVTAQDFKFSFERAADPRGPDKASPYTLPTCDLYLSDIVGVKDKMHGRAETVAGVEVLDERTLRITIDYPKTYFLWKLTYPTSFVLDPDKIVHLQTGQPLNINWTENPNGTGPFCLEEKTLQKIVLVKNKNYYLDLPLIDRIVFNLEGGDAITFYQQGQIHMVGIGVDEINRLHEFKGKYFSTPEFGIYYIGFNMARPPFDDPNLRRAFALAIDLKTILHVVLKDLLVAPQGILPPGIPGYRENFKGPPYDPQKAKELLTASRYWNPATQRLEVAGEEVRLALSRSGRGPAPGKVTVAIQDMWRKNLGIEVATRSLDFNSFQKELELGKFDMFIHGWIADYPDPEDFLDLKFHSERRVENRNTRYKNSEVDELLNLARKEQDHEKRMALYQQAEDIIMTDLPWIPLFYTQNNVMVNPQVTGYYPLPMVIPIFRYIDLIE